MENNLQNTPKKLVGKNKLKIINANDLKGKIYTIRGKQVMLDVDLAKIYGYETRYLNQQVSRNIEKFEGEDFMFHLTKEEMALMSHFATSKTITNVAGDQDATSGKGGTRKPPYVFTEQGIYMLMTVLKGDLAIRQSRALVMAFKAMKDFILQNQKNLDNRNSLQLALQVADNSKDIAEIKNRIKDLDSTINIIVSKIGDTVKRSELSPFMLDFEKTTGHNEYIFMNGQPAKASEVYIKIFSQAKESIQIVDNYIDVQTLRFLQKVQPGVKITIFSDNKGRYLHLSDYQNLRQEFPDIKPKFIKTCGQIHDRFILLDSDTDKEKILHCGASSKDAGNKMAAITEFRDVEIKTALKKALTGISNNPKLKLQN